MLTTNSSLSPASPARRLGYALIRALSIGLLYFLTARLSLVFVVQPEGLAAAWPPSGFALAVLLLSRKRDWPLTLTSLFLASLLANLSIANSLILSVGFAFANAVEALAAAWLLTHYVGRPLTFAGFKDVLGLAGLAAGVSNALTAVLGAAVVSLGLGTPYWDAWRAWWVPMGLGCWW